MYETYNFLIKKINMPLNGQKLKENYIKILSVFSPVFHISPLNVLKILI